MSLHTLASNLQHAGRGDDKVLVHMTPGEVSGLQKLAEDHGGSLTTNPQTGLPEAGFLSAILPMVAGLALGPAGVGLTAMQAGLAVGAVGTLATGSLGKGIMAGLGAYGGAGLGSGLVEAGTSTAATTPSALAGNTPFGTTMGAGTTNVGLGTSPFEVANKAVQAGGLPAYTGFTANPSVSGMFNPNVLAQNTAAQTAMGQTAAAASPGSFFDTRLAANNLANPVTPSVANAPTTLPRLNVNEPKIYSAVDVRDVAAQTQKPIIDASQYPRAEKFVQTPEQIAFSQRPTPELSNFEKAQAGFKNVTSSGKNAWEFVKSNPMPFISTGIAAAKAMQPEYEAPAVNQGMIRPYEFTYGATGADTQPYSGSGERTYFSPQYTAKTPYKAPGPEYAADGGLMGLSYAVGGPVEQMSAENAIGANQMYPQSQLQTAMYSNPMVQRPQASNIINPSGDAGVDPYSGEARFADGGLSTLGGYSDGGRLLKGPGDGVSDSIPAVIGNRQPARLADGEFVIPARIVSELGNGSTEAGAKRLYAMMERVQKARGKTTGKGKVAVNSKADKHLPA